MDRPFGRLSALLGLPADRAPRIAAIAPHPDDLEIGAGGTLLRLVDERPDAHLRWITLSGNPERAAEAERSARALSAGLDAARGGTLDYSASLHPDGYFPAAWGEVKGSLATHGAFAPDVVLAPRREDLHQDHRVVAELAWQVFRTSTILEYEIPKWEGDLGTVNLYVPLTAALAERKLAHLATAFPSQSGTKDWYTSSTFMAILRLRGLEARAPEGLAEGFLCRKLVA